MTTERRAPRWVLLLTLLFTVQAALTLALYFEHRTRRLENVLRVYTSAAWLPGASAALRVGVVDAASGRAGQYDAISVDIDPSLGTLDELDRVDAVFALAHAAVASESAVGEITATLQDRRGERTATARVTVARSLSWLDDRDRFRGDGAERRPNLSVAAGDDPRVRIRRPAMGSAPCGVTPWIAANGGVVATGLENALSVRLSRNGAPEADVDVTLTDAGGRAVRARTDSLGVATFTVRAEVAETWTLAFACDGGVSEREVDVVPSWDGLVVRPSASILGPGRAFGFSAVHQRTWGEWHQDVYCDGAWLATESSAVNDRPVVLGLPTLRLPTDARVRLCLLEGYTIWMSPDPPRSVAYFLLAPSAEEGVRALMAAVLAHGEPDLRGTLGPGTEAALAVASDAERERFARWLLDAIPQPFEVAPLAVDDRGAASAEFDAAQRVRGRALLTAIVIDALVLLLAVFAVLIPATVRQRARLQAVIDSLEESELDDGGDVASVRRAGWTMAVGILALAATLVGFAVLLLVLR